MSTLVSPELVPYGSLNAAFATFAASSSAAPTTSAPASSAVGPRASHYGVSFPSSGAGDPSRFTPAALTAVSRTVDPVLGVAVNTPTDVNAALSGVMRHDAWAHAHLRWLLQKDALGNDVMLLGTGPLRRWLALHWCALAGRECEHVAITRDTTEGDLKQRCEITAGGSSVYSDSPVVAAALHGRVLILEGLEKAERNVLPILNNLLENREMQLEDGRFLVAPARYEAIVAQAKAQAKAAQAKAPAQSQATEQAQGDSGKRSGAAIVAGRLTATAAALTGTPAAGPAAAAAAVAALAATSAADSSTSADAVVTAAASRLVPVHPRFRVVAIGAPVPPYPGSPLDPPLRSRFQGRRIDLPPPRALVSLLAAAYLHTGRALVAGSQAASDHKSQAAARWVSLALTRFVAQLSAVTSRAATGAGVASAQLAYTHLPLPTLPGLLLAAATAAAFPALSLPACLHAGFPWTLVVTQEDARAAVDTAVASLALAQAQSPAYARLPALAHATTSAASAAASCEQYDVIIVSAPATAPAAAAAAAAIEASGTALGACPAVQALTAAHSADAESATEGPGETLQAATTDTEGCLLTVTFTPAAAAAVMTPTIASAHVSPTEAASSSSAAAAVVVPVVAGAGLTPAPWPTAAAASAAAAAAAAAATATAATAALKPMPVPALSFAGGRLQRLALASLLRLHALGRDICLVGARGEGKSYLAGLFARALGYAPVETLSLYTDMSARDLLQRRSTSAAGETIWLDSPLVTALRRGRLCVLDGLHRLAPGTVSALARLLEDRELTLFDQTRLLRFDRYAALRSRLNLTDAELAQRKIFPISPAFRVLALAAPAARGQAQWLTHDVLGYFAFVPYALLAGAAESAPPSDEALELALIQQQQQQQQQKQQQLTDPNEAASSSSSSSAAALLVAFKRRYSGDAWLWGAAPPRVAGLLSAVAPGCAPQTLLLLEAFAVRSRELAADPLVKLQDPVSLRQLLRAARRCAAFPGQEWDAIARVCLFRFMPPAKREMLIDTLQSLGLAPPASATETDAPVLSIATTTDTVTIGGVTAPRHVPQRPELVPSVLFYDIPRHVAVLREMLLDFAVLREHILLIGVQGVGKNKLADRLLQLLRREREYMQLHRDSTVQSLTLSPSLERGVVVWADSPLVRALKGGLTLMLDEVDKAPTEVVCVLKSLLEDGEILLGDGRRFVTERSPLWADAQDPVLTQDTTTLPSSSTASAAAAPATAAGSFSTKVEESPDGTCTHGSAAAGSVYRAHPDFRVIALANPPGYPFFGNDFYAELGDCFACHAVDNPDLASEVALLRAYAPSLPQATLDQLARAFAALRRLNADGSLSYPYSTRELVQTARHLQAHPRDPVATVLQGVLSFDSYDPALQQKLAEAFAGAGIALPPPGTAARAPEEAPEHVFDPDAELGALAAEGSGDSKGRLERAKGDEEGETEDGEAVAGREAAAAKKMMQAGSRAAAAAAAAARANEEAENAFGEPLPAPRLVARYPPRQQQQRGLAPAQVSARYV
jgi:MoxR-like ATPase